ncbi:MAG: response regulator transcription factor [Deltaproteobacteria bacterium]|nr:response regulator transcription factor [Deltaproteobacteria bacterium]
MEHTILFANARNEHSASILQYLRDDFEILIPPSYEDIFVDPYLESSLAIIDHDFSEQRGLDALKSLKTAKPSIPVIYVASSGSEYLCMKVFRLGARDYFSRPFRADDIIKSVKTILETIWKNERFRSVPQLDKLDTGKGGRPRNGNKRSVYQKIEKARVFIHENYSKELPLELVANVASMSKYHFSRKFSEFAGMPYKKYLNSIRLREAKRLLRFSPFTIIEICFAVGYNDITYFERVFKKSEGCNPTTYLQKFNTSQD